MNENTVFSKQPWTVRWALGILGTMIAVGNVYVISNGGWTSSSLVSDVIAAVILFLIWQGRRWARNILFFYLLFILPLMVAGSGLLLVNPINYDRFADGWFIYGFLATFGFMASMVLLFSKRSNEWFALVNGDVEQKSPSHPSWNLQLVLIVSSMGLGFLAMGIAAMVNLLPLGKEVAFNFSDPVLRLAVLSGFMGLEHFIGSITVFFPFGLFLGYWRKGNSAVFTRLMTIGAIFPMLLFLPGKTLGLISLFFLEKLVITVVVIYISLKIGEKISGYFGRLKRRNAPSSSRDERRDVTANFS